MADLDLDALEKLARKQNAIGHEGPWDALPDGGVSVKRGEIIADARDTFTAEFIAAANPTVVLSLIARVREAEKDRDDANRVESEARGLACVLAGLVRDLANEGDPRWQATIPLLDRLAAALETRGARDVAISVEMQAHDVTRQERDALTREVAALRAALATYGHHRNDCASRRFVDESTCAERHACSCGLDAAKGGA